MVYEQYSSWECYLRTLNIIGRTKMENYKRFLLNRATVTPEIIASIESYLTNGSQEYENQSFHKIIIHNWQDSLGQLFDLLGSYFGAMFIPVNCTSQGDLTTFYTSNLSLIMKIIKFDFIFPYCRSMVSIDVLLNHKLATDFFGTITTIEDIVSEVVCKRFNEKCELDLSNFCEDPEFVRKKIWFYKLSLLAQFKILMLRMGRDTKKLILRNNNLSQAPGDILNFFIKADLTAIDLSYNDIPSLNELYRISSKIEKLWIEGNPLCEDADPITYVKNVAIKFPRLIELDGIKFNQHGIIIPFFRNYLFTPDRKTKVVVEEFVNRYFSNFDCPKDQRRIKPFYEECATLTISSTLPEGKRPVHYEKTSRNILNSQDKQNITTKFNHRVFRNQDNISEIYSTWPETIHDQTTFTVDVLRHNETVLVLIIDGVFKELVGPGNPSQNIFQFRRNFIFNVYKQPNHSLYTIQHEMLHVTFASNDQIMNSFRTPIVNMNSLTPVSPTADEKEAISRAFQNLTQLKTPEADLRLKYYDWNIQAALIDFTNNLRDNKIPADRFMDDDNFSDSSSLLDELD